MNRSWLEGHEPARAPEVARHYTGELDWTTISPTIDWSGGGLITTMADLALFVRALWSERIIGSRALGELTRWTPGATFPPAGREHRAVRLAEPGRSAQVRRPGQSYHPPMGVLRAGASGAK